MNPIYFFRKSAESAMWGKGGGPAWILVAWCAFMFGFCMTYLFGDGATKRFLDKLRGRAT